MPQKVRIKPMLPTLRECKRYVAFEVISPKKIKDSRVVFSQIKDSCRGFLGASGMSKAGILFIDKWNEAKQRGLIRVNYKHVNDLKASFTFVREIEGNEAIVKSVGVSGILKKAEKRYLAS